MEACRVPPPVDVLELSAFLLDFSTTMLAVGSQPSRVVRGAQRIGASFGHDVDLVVMAKHVIMTVISLDDPAARRTSVRIVRPAAFNFDMMLKLNVLSWNAHDFQLPLDELRRRYDAVMSEPRFDDRLVLGMVALANAAFCRLFGGDFVAVAVVGLVTLVAFYLRQCMMRTHMDHRIIFMAAAFTASMLAALAIPHVPTETPQIALGTSVLFLIPGVPLINAINDIIEGFVLLGFVRAVNASILIICIALGLAATLMIMGVNVT